MHLWAAQVLGGHGGWTARAQLGRDRTRHVISGLFTPKRPRFPPTAALLALSDCGHAWPWRLRWLSFHEGRAQPSTP